MLAEHALAMVALAMADHPDAGIVYSDEDKLDDAGRPARPLLQTRLRSRCCSSVRTTSATCACSVATS